MIASNLGANTQPSVGFDYTLENAGVIVDQIHLVVLLQ